jgi:hypothetical protein
MSTLLERMVKRARAPLPGIEPLLRPRYAHSGALAGRSHRDTIMEASELPSTKPEPAGRFSDQSPHIPPAASGARDEIAGPGAPRSGERVSEPDLPQIGERHSPEFRPRQSEGSPSLAQIHRPASASDSAPQIAPALPDLNSRSASPPTKTAPGLSPELIAGQVVATRRIETAHPPFSPPSTKLSSWQQPAPEQEAAAEKSAGVTISIGHIEIRAAQVIEHPRKPPFRPRVSLSEFLSQRNGERS